jgi:transcriptional regulator with XRE-family HTH domain
MTLDAWLSSTRTPDNEFARRIDVSRVTLFRLKTGRRSPNKRVMELIHTATAGAVTPNDFFNIGETSSAPERVAS